MGLAVRFNIRTLMYILLVAMVLLILDIFFMMSVGRHKSKFVENKSRWPTRLCGILLLLHSHLSTEIFFFFSFFCLHDASRFPTPGGHSYHMNVCNHGNVSPWDLINVLIVLTSVMKSVVFVCPPSLHHCLPMGGASTAAAHHRCSLYSNQRGGKQKRSKQFQSGDEKFQTFYLSACWEIKGCYFFTFEEIMLFDQCASKKLTILFPNV